MKKVLTYAFCLVPYVYYLLKDLGCGWDCGFYYHHLARTGFTEYHAFIEPLYFYVFKPLTFVTNPIYAVKISQFLMILFFLWGVARLCENWGWEWNKTGIALVLVSFNLGIFNLWDDTLRNFLAVSMFPHMMYYYFRSRYAATGATAFLMALAHRASLVMVPTVMIYEYWANKKKALTAGILLTITVTGVYVGFGIPKGVFILPLKISQTIHPAFWFHNLKMFVSRYFYHIALWSITVQFFNKKRLMDKFLYSWVGVFFISTVLFDHNVGGRLGLVTSIPLSIGIGYYYNEIKDYWITKIILVGIILTMLLSVYSVIPQISHADNEFVQELDLPKDSIVLVPSRIHYLTKLYHDDVYDVRGVDYWRYAGTLPPSNKSLAYHGINNFGEKIYLIDGNHFIPDENNPLHVRVVE